MPRRLPTRQLSSAHRTNNAFAQVVRIGSGHTCWPPAPASRLNQTSPDSGIVPRVTQASSRSSAEWLPVSTEFPPERSDLSFRLRLQLRVVYRPLPSSREPLLAGASLKEVKHRYHERYRPGDGAVIASLENARRQGETALQR